ncbi:hypothetical protein JF50_14110 [Pseudoalteromonas luteoviolacea]|uniref:Uncharacterized protein n=1 Tax=Pseudoalteromonas luteoviolacea TaxID=43657 RepID=A0A0C1MJ43_9GAMM|nr:hypothetical protein [Pseudoalteromonas luteoviolacea]KID56999.1 hypothetical protein JF50_14110 [Pseudoalteromonas luteoviolacea]
MIIESNGTVDFDTGVSFDASMIMSIADRRNIENEPRIQISYGADDDGQVIQLFLNTDLQSIKMIQYRYRTENIDVTTTVVSVTGGSGG